MLVSLEPRVAVFVLNITVGAADKIQGSVIELDDKNKHALARKEPIG